MPPGFLRLSPRERAVMELARRGLDNKVIAYELGIAHATVKVLVARAAAKLGVRTRQALVQLALLHGQASARGADPAGR